MVLQITFPSVHCSCLPSTHPLLLLPFKKNPTLIQCLREVNTSPDSGTDMVNSRVITSDYFRNENMTQFWPKRYEKSLMEVFGEHFLSPKPEAWEETPFFFFSKLLCMKMVPEITNNRFATTTLRMKPIPGTAELSKGKNMGFTDIVELLYSTNSEAYSIRR